MSILAELEKLLDSFFEEEKPDSGDAAANRRKDRVNRSDRFASSRQEPIPDAPESVAVETPAALDAPESEPDNHFEGDEEPTEELRCESDQEEPAIEEAESPAGSGERSRCITAETLASVFESGPLKRKDAVAAIMAHGHGQTAAYEALWPGGRFAEHLVFHRNHRISFKAEV